MRIERLVRTRGARMVEPDSERRRFSTDACLCKLLNASGFSSQAQCDTYLELWDRGDGQQPRFSYRSVRRYAPVNLRLCLRSVAVRSGRPVSSARRSLVIQQVKDRPLSTTERAFNSALAKVQALGRRLDEEKHRSIGY
jgi:hypothetical protein